MSVTTSSSLHTSIDHQMKVSVKAQSELYNEISNLPPYALGI